MKADMYPQAIELLNKRINEKPTDAEAHYQLGVCYLETGTFTEADERFASSVKLDPDTKGKIGMEYKQAGIDARIAGRISQAVNLFEKAIHYNPDLQTGIAREYKKAASLELSKGNASQAQDLFQKAVQYQSDFKKGIAQECFTAGKLHLDKQQGSSADGLLAMAVKYDPSLEADANALKQDYGKKLLEIAKEQPKKQRKKYIEQAKNYVSQEEVDAVFPPPTWKTVFGPKKYTGNGFGKKDYIKTAEYGKDILYGDKTVVTGNTFKVDNNGWQDYSTKYEGISKSTETGVYLGVMAAKGEKFTVEVQRLETSY
jgi:tetratricopeptide (TPR) repeat protein